MNRTDRRTFLAQAGAGLAFASLAQLAEAEGDVIPIIDTHQHLWDKKGLAPKWLPKQPTLNKSFLMEDYLQITKPFHVVKTVYMEVDLAVADQQAEADFVIKTCKSGKTPMVGGVISGRPATKEFAAYAKQFAGSPYIKGVRQVLHEAEAVPGLCLQPTFLDNIRLLGDLGLRYDICLRPKELPDGIKLADSCPKTKFVLDHCGNAEIPWGDAEREEWRKNITDFSKRRNVIAKVSGIIKTCKPDSTDKAKELEPFVRHVLRSFGPDRVMFGGDWPVCNLGASFPEWVKALRHIVRDEPQANQRKLFHDNAEKFYGL